MRSILRKSVAAGVFYPQVPEKLMQVLAQIVDETHPKQEVIGLVCPHAGYEYSGAVAGTTISHAKLTDTVIVLGTNHTGGGQPFSIMTAGFWETPLGNVEVDTNLATRLLGNTSHLVEDTEAHSREHSIEVLLPFLKYLKNDIKIVPIVLSHASTAVYKEIGTEMAEALAESGREAVIIASSDMTHYEPHEQAKAQDDIAIQAILKLDVDNFIEQVGEHRISMCGVAPVAVLMTIAESMGTNKAELVSYKTSGDVSNDYLRVVGYAGIIIRRPAISPLVQLARKSVKSYLEEGLILPVPSNGIPEMQEKAGVFVSIYKNGELRGCIGTFEPSRGNVAEEIIMNAISAATRDPRFEAVKKEELQDLVFSVDVLSEPEEIESKEQLYPQRYGVIVVGGTRRGLLLPDLKGVDTPEQQIDICRRKADIGADEKIRLFRFEVQRYK
ncbi:MAG: AmmeMemoRadiSam system protein B [Dehalococcoidia bacterium]|nr:AmmeMemoRadiSam system protein B [Dehalococcoidia bacterium]